MSPAAAQRLRYLASALTLLDDLVQRRNAGMRQCCRRSQVSEQAGATIGIVEEIVGDDTQRDGAP